MIKRITQLAAAVGLAATATMGAAAESYRDVAKVVSVQPLFRTVQVSSGIPSK